MIMHAHDFLQMHLLCWLVGAHRLHSQRSTDHNHTSSVGETWKGCSQSEGTRTVAGSAAEQKCIPLHNLIVATRQCAVLESCLQGVVADAASILTRRACSVRLADSYGNLHWVCMAMEAFLIGYSSP